MIFVVGPVYAVVGEVVRHSDRPVGLRKVERAEVAEVVVGLIDEMAVVVGEQEEVVLEKGVCNQVAAIPYEQHVSRSNKISTSIINFYFILFVERGSSVVECQTRNRIPLCYRFEDWAFSFSPLMPLLTQLYK